MRRKKKIYSPLCPDLEFLELLYIGEKFCKSHLHVIWCTNIMQVCLLLLIVLPVCCIIAGLLPKIIIIITKELVQMFTQISKHFF